jgi:hypothetical protein
MKMGGGRTGDLKNSAQLYRMARPESLRFCTTWKVGELHLSTDFTEAERLEMVGRVGLEPTTNALKGRCSTS